jgi:hypothetical protein
LKLHMETHGIKGEHLVFGQSCHSVEETAAARVEPASNGGQTLNPTVCTHTVGFKV